MLLSGLVLVGVRQQREKTRTFDRRGELTLVERARARQAGRRDLAVLADEIAQHVDFLVVDRFDIGDREAAEPLAPEQRPLLDVANADDFDFTGTTWCLYFDDVACGLADERSCKRGTD